MTHEKRQPPCNTASVLNEKCRQVLLGKAQVNDLWRKPCQRHLRMPAVGPPLLQDICLQRLSDHISEATSLAGLSEDLVCVLFELVIYKRRLTPEVLQLFVDTEHDLLLAKIKSLNLQTLLPRLPMTRNRWLGQNPSWY